MVYNANERSIYGKKLQSGVILVKTNKSILVGNYDENITPGEATVHVEKIADFLLDKGYWTNSIYWFIHSSLI